MHLTELKRSASVTLQRERGPPGTGVSTERGSGKAGLARMGQHKGDLVQPKERKSVYWRAGVPKGGYEAWRRASGTRLASD